MNLNDWTDWQKAGRGSEWCVLACAGCWRGCKESIRRFRLSIDCFTNSVNLTSPPLHPLLFQPASLTRNPPFFHFNLILISCFLCFRCFKVGVDRNFKFRWFRHPSRDNLSSALLAIVITVNCRAIKLLPIDKGGYLLEIYIVFDFEIDPIKKAKSVQYVQEFEVNMLHCLLIIRRRKIGFIIV